ncbi:MAG: hypothetical protein NZ789_17730, partial [Pseudomonadales bacterium]|nr:hypothetical protein [Pseudomonadales bacterium]
RRPSRTILPALGPSPITYTRTGACRAASMIFADETDKHLRAVKGCLRCESGLDLGNNHCLRNPASAGTL